MSGHFGDGGNAGDDGALELEDDRTRRDPLMVKEGRGMGDRESHLIEASVVQLPLRPPRPPRRPLPE